jgi:hypothetical protein
MTDKIDQGRAGWIRDELILALDVYLHLAPVAPDPRSPEVRDLSELLRGQHIHPYAQRNENFRSPASIVMKLMNFRSIDPSYGGKGLTAGGRLDRQIWKNSPPTECDCRALQVQFVPLSMIRPMQGRAMPTATRETIWSKQKRAQFLPGCTAFAKEIHD